MGMKARLVYMKNNKHRVQLVREAVRVKEAVELETILKAVCVLLSNVFLLVDNITNEDIIPTFISQPRNS